ncbi:MAG: biotin transporter BioY [Natronospirillum sp.]|uniref:biotin transporter BioY n=1 Tax=Natronospirillum sp. TaxID=2812955 RepID=UPI0025E03A84|nr:biotin transporter BioY [Natronospirillum sp.]MCH8550774.1 biotin transporter BioY [Natronospirillum sp.]
MKDRSLVQIALYASLVAALGFIPPIPFAFGVPITAQSLGVMLAGIMLGPWRGALAMLLLVFVVSLGAPLLAGGRGGLGVLTGPTVGFFLGWPLAAFFAGLIAQSLRRLPLMAATAIGAFTGGIVVLYLCGIAGFKLVTGNGWIESTLTMAVFIPGDLVKVVITCMVAQAVYKGMPQAVATRAT